MNGGRRSRGRTSLWVAVVAAFVAGTTILPAGAHVTSEFPHLWNDHILPRIQQPGTINDPDNPVHWTKLKGVPGGFADGTDDGATVAGFGLEKFPAFGGGTGFRVNTDQIQRRVQESCGVGGISQINKDGSVACSEGVSGAFYYFDDDVGSINSESMRSVGALRLPRGLYMVWAKVTVRSSDVRREELRVHCELRLGANFDAAWTLDTWEDIGANADTLPMMVIGASSKSAPEADVQCTDFGTTARGSELKIMAIRIGSVNPG